MKQIVFLSLIWLSVINSIGQTQNVDSLVDVLNTKKVTTEEQLNLYQSICYNYFFNAYDIERTMEYAIKGLNLSKKEKNELKSSVFNEYIGYVYLEKINYDTACIYFEKALELAVKVGNEEQLINVYTDIGSLYGNKEMYDLSLEQFLKALPLAERLENKKKYMVILGNIGSIHRLLNNTDKAIFYFEQLKEMAERIDNISLKQKAYYELGALYKDQMQYDRSFEYLDSALNISRSTGYKQYETMCLQTLAQIYSRDDFREYDKAIQYAKESLAVSGNITNPYFLFDSWLTLSTVYSRQEKYQESIYAAHKAMECDTTSIRNMLGIYTNLTDAYIGLGKKDSAAFFFHKYREVKDLCITKELQASIADMEVKYETEKKEMRIATLEKEKQLYSWLAVISVLLILTLIIVLWLTIRNARKEKLLIATRSVLDGEMRERTRLAQDLHDRLSGNLSAVKIELSSQAESMQNVCKKLDHCIRDVRNAAHDLMPTSLQYGMKVALEDYAAQFPNVKFHFFGEEKRIDKRLEFVVYCCANELVNNSVKHSDAKNINLQLVQDEKHITLTVSDDGCGYDEKASARGFGLQSIRNRVASCNGKMDVATSLNEGTETTIELRIMN